MYVVRAARRSAAVSRRLRSGNHPPGVAGRGFGVPIASAAGHAARFRGHLSAGARAPDWQTDKTFEIGPARIDGLAVSRGGDFLATASEKRGVQVFDLNAGALPIAWSSFMGSHARCVVFGPGGRLLCGGYTWAHHWDWRADRKPQLLGAPPDYINSIVFCGGDQFAAFGGHEEMVRVVPLGHAEPRRDFLGHAGRRIWCVAASPDGARLATASDDRTVKLWSLKPAKGILTDEQPVPLRAVRFLPDGRTLLAARGDGALQRWRITPEDDLPRSSGRLSDSRLSLPANPAAGGADAGRVWQIAGSTVLGGASLAAKSSDADGGASRAVRDTIISPDCRLAAVCGYDSSAITLLDASTGQVIGELALPADISNYKTRAMCFSLNGQEPALERHQCWPNRQTHRSASGTLQRVGWRDRYKPESAYMPSVFPSTALASLSLRQTGLNCGMWRPEACCASGRRTAV